MPPRNPVEFSRDLASGNHQPCGNRVQLEDADGAALDAANPLVIGDGWELLTAQDLADNDSDKAFAVPAGYLWHVLAVRVFFTADANAGNRQVAVRLLDDLNAVLDEVRVGATQAATEARYYELGPSLADLTDFRDTDWLMTPIPPTWLLEATHQLAVLDQNAISAAGDDMHVYYRYARKLA